MSKILWEAGEAFISCCFKRRMELKGKVHKDTKSIRNKQDFCTPMKAENCCGNGVDSKDVSGKSPGGSHGENMLLDEYHFKSKHLCVSKHSNLAFLVLKVYGGRLGSQIGIERKLPRSLYLVD